MKLPELSPAQKKFEIVYHIENVLYDGPTPLDKLPVIKISLLKLGW